MRKRKDWKARLHAFFVDSRSRRFAYGRWDCVLFAAGAVAAMGGPDLIPRGLRWRDGASAERTLRALYGGLERAVSESCAKMKPISADFRLGDVVIYDGDKGPALGIHDGFGIKSPGADGLVTHALPARRGWRMKG